MASFPQKWYQISAVWVNMTDRPRQSTRRASDWRLAGRLLHYLYPYKWKSAVALVLLLANVPFATAGPLLTKAAIDLFILPDPSRQASGYVLWLKHEADLAGLGGSRHQGIVFIATLYLLANVFQLALQYWRMLITETVGQNVVHDLRQEIFGHLQKVPIQFYDRNPVGKLMTCLTTDMGVILELLNSSVILLGHLAMMFYTLAWMFRINIRLTVVSCFVLMVVLAFTSRFHLKSQSAFHQLREWTSTLNVFWQEHLAGVHTVQVFSRERQELSRFQEINRAHCQSAVSVARRNAFYYPAIENMLAVGIAVILWWGGGEVIHHLIGLGSLIAFMQFAQSFYDPIYEISLRHPMMLGAMASCEKIFALLDEPAASAPPDPSARLDSLRGQIEFRNVWFAYESEDWILKDVSFTVEPGEKVAFVGRTGAGKTTIASLLLRFYEIQRGEILLDGTNIRQLDLQELRSKFSVVPQDICLFPSDIASNVRLRNHLISEEKVREAARAAYMDEVILKLEKGYESEVSENGLGLSVGQKQLMGFARALAFDRPILILDEATSSLDPRTEVHVREAARRTMANRTALVITHRLSMVQEMDKIVVMHDGTIRESGDHKTLLAQRGLYWMLYQLQIHGEPRAEGRNEDASATLPRG
jgi:ATP-binding cassette, subfamily B, multidrug efflux pump